MIYITKENGLEINELYAGLDIGGTKCAVLLARAGQGGIEILSRDELVTDTSIPPEDMLARMEPHLRAHVERGAKAVGVSCGGPLDSKKGVVLSPPNLPGWDEFPIVKLLEESYGVPARLQNDANACAFAEWKFGAGKGTSNMVFYTMGTGFGAGLVLNGALYSGTNDFAGEIGHVRLAPLGPAGFGKQGSVEGFCSGGGIAQLGRNAAMAKLQLGVRPSFCPSMAELDTITAKTLGLAAADGDETALEVWEDVGMWLGRAIAMTVDLLNPEVIVIGSIFVRAGRFIRPSMERAIASECLPGASAVCRVVPAALGESLGDIAAISVAML